MLGGGRSKVEHVPALAAAMVSVLEGAVHGLEMVLRGSSEKATILRAEKALATEKKSGKKREPEKNENLRFLIDRVWNHIHVVAVWLNCERPGFFSGVEPADRDAHLVCVGHGGGLGTQHLHHGVRTPDEPMLTHHELQLVDLAFFDVVRNGEGEALPRRAGLLLLHAEEGLRVCDLQLLVPHGRLHATHETARSVLMTMALNVVVLHL